MPYNKEELMNLPIKEKQELAEALWNSIEDNLLPVTEDEIAFAEERLKLHEANPSSSLTLEELKNKIQKQYGF